MLQRDYLMRVIQQVVEAILRMLGLIEKDDPERALRVAADAYDLLGIPRELTEVADSQTLAELCGRPEKTRILARLLAAEGDAYAALRDPLQAMARRKLSMELNLEAHRVDPRDEDYDVIREIARRVPESALDERFRRE